MVKEPYKSERVREERSNDNKMEGIQWGLFVQIPYIPIFSDMDIIFL